MPKFSVNETMKRAEEEYGLGSGQYFKVQEGQNKIRLLSACIGHESEFKGNRTFKFVCWILDRKDGKVKIYFMPVTILNHIGAFQLDSDYAFDEVPMPYDITITAKGAGTKEVEYSVIPSPNRISLTADELNEFNSKAPIDEVIAKLKEKQPVKEPEIKAEPVYSPEDLASQVPF